MPIEIRGLTPLLSVFDMLAAVSFYRDVLGFEIVNTSDPYSADGRFHWALLRLNGVDLMLNTAYDEEDQPLVPDAARWAAHRDTAIYFACPDVDAAYRHICEKCVKVNPPGVAPYGMKQLSIADPDGYHLCFQWPALKPATP